VATTQRNGEQMSVATVRMLRRRNWRRI